MREAIEHLLRTRTGVTKTWLIDKLVAIIDTDLADVSEWDEDGDLVFKTSGELTSEHRRLRFQKSPKSAAVTASGR